ncbi:universal stress protein [Actinomycetospora soli]|uniref:universal stress protein n=1 Tax=Actinomycetospora soli TaxID=2893887 RepID=UPI001E654817|nr:universal stress protein [Actinomycetospora soli]MCD2187402.1 universal stress protein [Actinomycetospora soli]
MLQVVALRGPSDPHAPDRVGHVRSTGIRAYAPAHLPREAVLRWAARHAHQTGADLQVLVDEADRPDRPVSGPVGRLVEVGSTLGTRLLELVGRPSPRSLAPRLAGAAAGTRLLVLPAALPDLEQVVAAAPEPVVVVPDRPLSRGPAPVVLGLGPDTGHAATTLAFDAAAGADVPLRVVRAGDDGARQDCRDGLAAWRLVRPEVAVDVDVVDADAATALRDRARTAALLVVGQTSRSPWREWMLPSPALALLRDPPCPVAVVPDRAR